MSNDHPGEMPSLLFKTETPHFIEKKATLASISVLLCSSDKCTGCLFDFDGVLFPTCFLRKDLRLEMVDVLMVEEVSAVACFSEDIFWYCW
jgi:hypothetical protein